MKQFKIKCMFILHCLLITRSNCSNSPEETGDLFEGDIAINEDEENALENGEQEAGILGAHYRWKDGIIPYTISEEFEKPDQKNIMNAMREISEKTCIRFKPRETEKDFVHFQNGRGCSSTVGRQGTGKQAITLMIPGCVKSFGTIIHETLHAIGFWHEQSRTDRDKFVDIKWRNIDEEKKHNFNKFTSRTVHEFGVPYDYKSVMHYPDSAFISNTAAKQQQKTIVPRVSGVHIGQRKGLSKLDALKVNRMYECLTEERGKEMTSTAKPVKSTIPTTTSTTTTKTTTTTTPTPTTTTLSLLEKYQNYYYNFDSDTNSIEPRLSRLWWY